MFLFSDYSFYHLLTSFILKKRNKRTIPNTGTAIITNNRDIKIQKKVKKKFRILKNILHPFYSLIIAKNKKKIPYSSVMVFFLNEFLSYLITKLLQNIVKTNKVNHVNI